MPVTWCSKDKESEGNKLISPENINYTQKEIGYFEFQIGVKKVDNTNFIVAIDTTNEPPSIVNIAFVFTFLEAILSKSSGAELEQKNFVGPVSAIT